MAFNPDEPRGPGGKWIHLGAAIEKVAGLEKGKRTYVNGHVVRNLDQGYRVRINGVAKNYSSHEEAARAMHAGEHIGSTPEAAVRREASRANAPKTSVTPEQVLGVRGGKVGQQRGGTSTGKRRGEQGKSDAQYLAERRFPRGQQVETDTGVIGHAGDVYAHPTTGEPMVQVLSSTYIRGQHHIKASKLTPSNYREKGQSPYYSREQERKARRAPMAEATPSRGRGVTTQTLADEQRQRVEARAAGDYGPGVRTYNTPSGNFGVSRNDKRVGIIIPPKKAGEGYTYEHKRGDQQAGYTSFEQAVRALIERDSRGESVGGRGETMRQYAGITSAADERAKVKREIASIAEQLREMGQPASGYTPHELVGSTRREDVQAQLDRGEKRIWVKVPSGSEVSMSPETARELMKQHSDQEAIFRSHMLGRTGMQRSYGQGR